MDNNYRSLRVLEKSGFTKAGRLRRAAQFEGGVQERHVEPELKRFARSERLRELEDAVAVRRIRQLWLRRTIERHRAHGVAATLTRRLDVHRADRRGGPVDQAVRSAHVDGGLFWIELDLQVRRRYDRLREISVAAVPTLVLGLRCA